jgi:hypothetical protein
MPSSRTAGEMRRQLYRKHKNSFFTAIIIVIA